MFVSNPLPKYLLQVARSSEGRRYRKQPEIDALRQYKEEILEAHRSGLSVHRIAQIFRERSVDISVPHLVRTIRRFVDEEERVAGKASTAQRGPVSDSSLTKEHRQESAAAEETKPKAPVTYQVSEQPSTRVQEEEFAKPRTPKQERPIAKAGTKTKAERLAKKTREEELAKERRRAGRSGHKLPSSGSGRGEKRRASPGR